MPAEPPGSPEAATARCGDECHWRDWASLPGVQVRPSWEKRGDDFFLVAEWKSTPTRRLDAWVWLKDGGGEETVYPFEDSAIGWHKMVTTPEGFRETFLLPIDLEKGRRYSVSISVQPYKPGARGPDISNPEVDGLMATFIYR
ncbi:hypothetical protein [Streptomyces sp. NBC_00102]|uniref:hypothetical protein n=1 Tax=Streptomyces sp. NBC_00102 TaxID=2975652 RepID=UPI00224D655B|nr:hypothetical protein [Streptomyces sp. NBC_00102]MCX5395597.1 hypothetical protein [Streptomyces sp. NBC_00102]